MDKIKANKTIVAIIVSFAVCLFVYIGIPALADDPPLEMSSIEKVLSGQMPPEEARKAADKVQEEARKNPRNNANYAALAFLYDYTGDYRKGAGSLEIGDKIYP